MSRRGQLDAVIVGGGVVGAACALALARENLAVALVEARETAGWSPQQRDLRVYAFAPDNATLLRELGVWQTVRDACAQPYRRMRVWDAAGGDELRFDADALGQPVLGWIVENDLLVDRLWQALQAAGVRVHCPATVSASEQDADGVRVTLDHGVRLSARLLIAADGAQSALRGMLGIEVDALDYAQSGVVGYVRTELPHEDTAWQRFLPGGPLAFLPFASTAQDARTCSIVWTLPREEATRVQALDDAAFASELTRAFDARLGAVQADSPRAAFPLRRQLAREYLRGRALLLGDAAHAVHPLAGQGVNLGLRDVAALRDSVRQAGARRMAFDDPQRLARWARLRKSENAVAAHTFTGINRLFSNDAVLPTLLRGHLLGAVTKAPPLLSLFWKRAAGL